jgi:hypothetical protein
MSKAKNSGEEPDEEPGEEPHLVPGFRRNTPILPETTVGITP